MGSDKNREDEVRSTQATDALREEDVHTARTVVAAKSGMHGNDEAVTEVLPETATQVIGDEAAQQIPTLVTPDETVIHDPVTPGEDLELKPQSAGAGGRPRIIKDRFVLKDRLGKGGQGEVYRALDLRKEELHDDQPFVAIKFLGEAFSRHPKALISLQREAKKTQTLAHPNILTVYDFDRDDTSVYMTMEMLEGESLSEWTHGPGSSDKQVDVATIIIQLAEGLDYAHSKGVIHSDLKPENVFLTSEGRIKILDFGIARIADAAMADEAFDAGELGALTPPYASLEMVQRNAEPAPADDLYALGLIAHRLYSGVHPFGGLSADVALERGLKPQRPEGITRYQWLAIEKALRFRREERTQSAREFLQVFTGARRRRQFTTSVAALLLLSSGFFAYQAEREKGPSVSFSRLPAAVQADITDKVSKGNQFLTIGDLDGASRYFIESWQLHPRNPDATAGLAAIVDELEQRVESAETQREREFLLRFFDAYADHPYFAGNSTFRELRESLAEVQD